RQGVRAGSGKDRAGRLQFSAVNREAPAQWIARCWLILAVPSAVLVRTGPIEAKRCAPVSVENGRELLGRRASLILVGYSRGLLLVGVSGFGLWRVVISAAASQRQHSAYEKRDGGRR